MGPEVRVLPRASRRSENFLDAHAFDAAADFLAIDAVAVANEKPWRRIEGERLAELLRNPRRRWLVCHVEMRNAAPVVKEDDEAVEQAKGSGRHNEEIMLAKPAI